MTQFESIGLQVWLVLAALCQLAILSDSAGVMILQLAIVLVSIVCVRALGYHDERTPGLRALAWGLAIIVTAATLAVASSYLGWLA